MLQAKQSNGKVLNFQFNFVSFPNEKWLKLRILTRMINSLYVSYQDLPQVTTQDQIPNGNFCFTKLNFGFIFSILSFCVFISMLKAPDYFFSLVPPVIWPFNHSRYRTTKWIFGFQIHYLPYFNDLKVLTNHSFQQSKDSQVI